MTCRCLFLSLSLSSMLAFCFHFSNIRKKTLMRIRLTVSVLLFLFLYSRHILKRTFGFAFNPQFIRDTKEHHRIQWQIWKKWLKRLSSVFSDHDYMIFFSILYLLRSKMKKKKKRETKVLLDLFVGLMENVLMNNKLDYFHDHDQCKSDLITSKK